MYFLQFLQFIHLKCMNIRFNGSQSQESGPFVMISGAALVQLDMLDLCTVNIFCFDWEKGLSICRSPVYRNSDVIPDLRECILRTDQTLMMQDSEYSRWRCYKASLFRSRGVTCCSR